MNVKSWSSTNQYLTIMGLCLRDYTQIHWGLNNNMGESTGVIEFKDFYFFLDAVRILARSNALNPDHISKLKSWFR